MKKIPKYPLMKNFLLMTKKGLFITFEGGDGAGKSTLIEGIKSFILEKGLAIRVTREPGGTSLGEEIRHWLLHSGTASPMMAKTELLLFLASRAQHIEEVIVPSLERGEVVLCDRFNDSSIAYQGVGRNLGLDYVEKLCDDVCQKIVPDLTFYLDLDPQLGMKRRQQVNEKVDRIEEAGLTFHQRVREGFLELARRHPRIHVIDAKQSAEAVLQEALKILESI